MAANQNENPIVLRPALKAWAEAMELKLRTQDAEKGNSYKHMEYNELLDLLNKELDELKQAIWEHELLKEPPETAQEETLDVGALAMMIFDCLGD